MKNLFLMFLFSLLSILIYPQSANWKIFTHPGLNNALRDYNFYCVTVDLNDVVWVGGDGYGVSKYENDVWTNYDPDTFNNPSNHAEIITLIPTGSNSFIYSYGRDVISYENNSFKILYADTVNWIAKVSGDVFWGSSKNKGLTKFNGSNITSYKYTEFGIYLQSTGKIIVDKNNIVWGYGIHQNTGVNDTIPTSDYLFSFDGTKLTIYPSQFTPTGYFQSIYADEQNNIWVGTKYNQVAKYNQTSKTWDVFSPLPTGSFGLNYIDAIVVDKLGTVWIGFDGGLASKKGNTWTLFSRGNLNSPLTGDWITGLAVDSKNNKWISFFSEYNLSGIAAFNENGFNNGVTGVEENSNQIPTEYLLSQNYPNPFNPSTNIKFDIKEEGLVTLKIYDVLGRQVRTLLNEEKAAGSYKVNFDAANLPSGIYFYRIAIHSDRLSSGNFTSVKKMILLR